MAKVETSMTIKLTESELLALQKLLTFQYQNGGSNLDNPEKGFVNGILFAIEDSQRSSMR